MPWFSLEPMDEFDRLFICLENAGKRQQQEDSRQILVIADILTRGVCGIKLGSPIVIKPAIRTIS